MFQLGDRLPLTKATCVRLIPIKLRALVLVQICNREAVMRTNISTDPGKRPRLLGELATLSQERSAEYKYGRGPEIFGAEEPADYLYQVIEGAVRSYKLLSDGRRQIGVVSIWRAISSACETPKITCFSVGTQDLTRTRGGVSSRNGSSPDTSGYHSPPNELPGYCGLPWAHTGDRIASSFRLKKRGFLKFLGQTHTRLQFLIRLASPNWMSKAAAELESTVHSPNGH